MEVPGVLCNWLAVLSAQPTLASCSLQGPSTHGLFFSGPAGSPPLKLISKAVVLGLWGVTLWGIQMTLS